MHNILFIHPDEKLVKLYAPVLSQHFAFDSAHDGLTALRKIRLQTPQAIISSYSLPFLSGLGLLKFVRSEPAIAATPFIFFADHENPNAALNGGANDWIFAHQSSPELLLNKIYQHLKYGIHFH